MARRTATAEDIALTTGKADASSSRNSDGRSVRNGSIPQSTDDRLAMLNRSLAADLIARMNLPEQTLDYSS